jgi:soluble lytic murein transglycosylase-like protein
VEKDRRRGYWRRYGVSFWIGVGLVLFICPPNLADIYRYQDENGVWHFTNVRTDVQYKLYIKESHKTGSEYIQEYSRIIKEAARTFKVESSLIKAVIKAESNFDPLTVSRKGAKGLMQLMPETADDMEVADPFSPEENIFGGTRYLQLLLERFGNNKRLAIAAYNAGPEVVETYRGMPPYSETTSFVDKVLYYYDEYRTKGE